MHSLRSKWFAVLLAYIFMFAEYAQGHVPGALLLPIQTLREHMGQVPADGSVLLLCRTGRRAETAYDMIREAYPQKKNLWFLKGIPVYGNDGSFTFK